MVKDEYVIFSIILFLVFTLFLVCCVDDDIDLINRTIDRLTATQEEYKWNLHEKDMNDAT